MGRFVARRVIQAPIERVFDLSAQPARLPEWNPFFVAVTRTSGPADRPPAAFDALMSLAGRQLGMHHLVTLLDPPHAITTNGVALQGGRLTWIRRFASAGPGETVVESEVDIDLPREAGGEAISAVVGDQSMEHAIRHDLVRSVENLATLIETDTQQFADHTPGKSADPQPTTAGASPRGAPIAT